VSNGFAGLGSVEAVEYSHNTGQAYRMVDAPGDAEIHVRQCWSTSRSWTELAITTSGDVRRFLTLADDEAVALARLLCESTSAVCGCGSTIGAHVHTDTHDCKLAATK
jgi:hypothetical protein